MAETTEQYRNRINQLKTSIENEPYIKEMREDIAEGISTTGNRQADIEVRQDKLEDDFVAVQQDASSASPSGAEVAVARGEYPTLDGRLTVEQQQVNAHLAHLELKKADQAFVDSQLAAIVGVQLTGTYTDLNALQSDYPTGASGIFLTLDNGHFYYWNTSTGTWTDGGAFVDPGSDELTLKWTSGYISSSNHGNGEGKKVTSSAGLYSQLIAFPKGTSIHIHVGGGNTVALLSKWTPADTYLDELIVGNGVNTDYEYTVVDDIEYLRVTTLIASVPQAAAFVKVVSTSADVMLPVYNDLNVIKDDLLYVKNYYRDLNLPSEVDKFITSSNMTSFPEGSVGTAAGYRLTPIFNIRSGDTINIKATGSQNVVILSKWTVDGVYQDEIIVGDDVKSNYYYTAIEDVEYLRVSSRTSDFFVGISEDLPEKVKELAVELPSIKSTVDSLSVGTSTPNPEAIRKPVINFQFDDGLVSDVNVVNKFKTYGFRCGFAIHSSNTRLGEYKSYQDEGFEILSHSTDPSGFNDETKALSWYKDKMKTSKEILEANGFDVKGWVTPSSQMLDSAIPLLKNFYEYAFTQYLGEWTGTTTPQNIFSEDTRRMKRVSMQNTTEENCINAIDKTISEGGILTFYAHKFPDTDLTDAKLTAILDHVKLREDSGDCLVLKPVDAYKHYYTLRHSDLVGLL